MSSFKVLHVRYSRSSFNSHNDMHCQDESYMLHLKHIRVFPDLFKNASFDPFWLLMSRENVPEVGTKVPKKVHVYCYSCCQCNGKPIRTLQAEQAGLSQQLEDFIRWVFLWLGLFTFKLHHDKICFCHM